MKVHTGRQLVGAGCYGLAARSGTTERVREASDSMSAP
jgi:hypothetical protein